LSAFNQDTIAGFVDPEDMIEADQAATLLQVRPQTLAAWRSQGRGPAYYKVGRLVRYRRQEIGAYIAGVRVNPKQQAARSK
jgi:hypothetical protein